MFRLICLAVGYAIGCVQSAFITGELMGKIDIRQYGSGNAGTTNVARVLGAKAGIIVFLLDILKGGLAFVICSLLFDGAGTFSSGQSLLPGVYAGLGVVLGHDFPFFLKFKGGKGVASSLGFMLCLDIRIALMTYAVGFIAFIVCQYVSVSSIIMVLIFPILMFVFKLSSEAALIMLVVGLLTIIRHSSNIQRLMHGNENKVELKKLLNKVIKK